MKSENPVQYSLRCVTFEIVSDLYNSGKFLTFKDACFHFFNTAQKKKVATGFKMETKEKFYNAFRQFKYISKNDRI